MNQVTLTLQKKIENMEIKQGEENTEFVKEEGESKDNYIFQKNSKTKTGTYIVIGFLILLVAGIIVSALFFGEPAA